MLSETADARSATDPPRERCDDTLSPHLAEMAEDARKASAAKPVEQQELSEQPPGFPCNCPACLRDGPHERDCAVHRKPPERCSCGRAELTKGPG